MEILDFFRGMGHLLWLAFFTIMHQNTENACILTIHFLHKNQCCIALIVSKDLTGIFQETLQAAAKQMERYAIHKGGASCNGNHGRKIEQNVCFLSNMN